jgi:hypothetical protein
LPLRSTACFFEVPEHSIEATLLLGDSALDVGGFRGFRGGRVHLFQERRGVAANAAAGPGGPE